MSFEVPLPREGFRVRAKKSLRFTNQAAPLARKDGHSMEILGVGGWELMAILLIMVVVAGPKRMIAWSYKLGQYLAVLRNMWRETAGLLQREFDNAGVDVRVPTEPPTRAALQKEVNRAFSPITKPLESSLSGVKQDLEASTRPASTPPVTPASTTPPAKTLASTTPASMYGQWGVLTPKAANSSNGGSNGAAPPEPPASSDGFGTWSSLPDEPPAP